MSKHSTHQQKREAVTLLSERVRVLEARVAIQAEALQRLTRGLAEPPTADPGGPAAADAARRASDALPAYGTWSVEYADGE